MATPTLVNEPIAEPHSAEETAGLEIGWRLRDVTVGGTLAGVLVFIAAFVRLYALGGQPLGETEAARAWLALQFVQGQPVELTGFSPLLTNLNLLVFFLAGTGDFWARLGPALFGVALVALPVAGFRHCLGIGGALAVSALIACSPVFLLFSRSVDPALLSAVTTLVFAGAVFDFIEQRGRRDLLIAAGALALALTAGPSTYTVLLFMLVFGIAIWFFGNEADRDRLVAAFQTIWRDRAGWSRVGTVFVAIFIVAATGFLVNFGGLQAALNVFVDWLGSFSLNPEYPIWYYTGTLALYEPALLLFGLLGAGIVVRQRDRFGLFLVTWFVGSLFVYTFIGATEPALIVPIALPLALLAGWGVAWLSEFSQTDEAWRALLVAAFIMPLLAYGIVQVITYVEAPTQSVRLFLALGAAAIAVVIALVFASSRFGMAWRPATVTRGAAISLLLVSLGLTVHTTWHLNFLAHKPVRELLLTDSTSPDMREMVSVIETISQNRVGDTVSIPITVDGRLSPMIPWYLQDFTNVTVVDEIRQPPGTPVVIMPKTEEMPPIGDQYIGQGFRRSSRWRPVGLSWRDLARWYLYREGPAVPNTELVIYVMR